MAGIIESEILEEQLRHLQAIQREAIARADEKAIIANARVIDQVAKTLQKAKINEGKYLTWEQIEAWRVNFIRRMIEAAEEVLEPDQWSAFVDKLWGL